MRFPQAATATPITRTHQAGTEVILTGPTWLVEVREAWLSAIGSPVSFRFWAPPQTDDAHT
jgi:hypothetical protein